MTETTTTTVNEDGTETVTVLPRMTVAQALAVIAQAGLDQVASKEKYRKWGLDDAIFLAAELFASKALQVAKLDDAAQFDLLGKWADWSIMASAILHSKVKDYPQD